MQMTDEVRRALQTLRDHAETDYELHWIDRLERDLTNPPKVEVVDNKHQRFLGFSFRKRKTGHFFSPMVSIYRLVWTYYRGELPSGAIVHHVDEDKDNNDISNLRAMTPHAHMILHKSQGLHGEKIFVCQDCGTTFSSTASRAWHCPTCRKIRQLNQSREQAKKKKATEETTLARLEQITLNKAARRAKTMASHIATCPVCGRIFYRWSVKRKGHTDRKTCSIECEEKLRGYSVKHPVDRHRICEICGKSFEYKHSPHQKTCSPECGRILSQRTRKLQQQK